MRDELRRHNQTQNVESTPGTSSNPQTERIERRLAGSLNRIRKPKGRRKKILDKKSGIQVRWIHFDGESKVFVPVRRRKRIAIARACESEPFLTSRSHFLRAQKVLAENIQIWT